MEITDFLGGAGACMLVCVCMCVCVCLGGCVRFQSAVANLSEGGSFLLHEIVAINHLCFIHSHG